jgi:Ca2+-binding RTX toxin-like protein
VLVDWGDGSDVQQIDLAAGVLNFSAAHLYLENSAGPPDGRYQVSVTLMSGDGASTSGATSVQVLDVAPTAGLSGPSLGVPGQPRTFTFFASSPSPSDQAAGFTYVIDWGDGSAVQVVSATPGNGAGFTLEHVYTRLGAFAVGVTVTDADGASSALSTQSITVAAVQLQGGDLVVGATGDETIVLRPANAAGAITVLINGVAQGNFRPTGHILVYGQGSDTIRLQSRQIGGTTYYIDVPAVLYGGDGNNVLDARGSTANNVLIGGGGNDVLYGGHGRDVLIGGGGADRLHAGSGDDILIGGSTAYDPGSPGLTAEEKLAALYAILAEWGRDDADYATRVSHLLGPDAGGSSGGLNGTPFLNPSTVTDDGAGDVLIGSLAALDWFFLSGDGADTVSHLRRGEQVTFV